MTRAKESMNAATAPEETRVFLYSPQHVDDYNKIYSKNDIQGYGPTRYLVTLDENNQRQEFYYTHTIPAAMDADVEAIKKEYKIEDARLVWHGPKSRILFFGVKSQMPTIRSQNILS